MPIRSFLQAHRRAVLLAVVLSGIAVAAAWLWRPFRARSARFIEYPMTVSTDIPTAVAVAPDGSVWFSIDFSDAVGVVRAGKIERFVKPSRSTEPIGIAVDTGGKVWVTDAATVSIVGVSAAGELQSVKLGTPIARLGRMAAAPDGSVWFAEASAYSITRLKDGELTRHAIDSVRGGPYGVAVAADGTVWATLQGANALLRIAPDGKMTEHEIPTPGVSPTDVAVDAAGTVWFLEFRTDRIGKFQRRQVRGTGAAGSQARPHRPGGRARRCRVVRHAAQGQHRAAARRQDRRVQAAARTRAALQRGGRQVGQRLVRGHQRLCRHVVGR